MSATATDIKPADPDTKEPDPDTGKLFEVPRVKITVDDADPNVIKLSFSGSIELDRTVASDVALYNRLKPGTDHDLNVGVFIAGPKTTHRRDSDGNVDSVVQTKTIVVHSLTEA